MIIIDSSNVPLPTLGANAGWNLTTDEPLRLVAGVTLQAQDYFGLFSDGADHTITIEGRVLGGTSAIRHDGRAGADESVTLTVAATGRVEGNVTGVHISASDFFVSNAGIIYGPVGVVAEFVGGGAFSQFRNTGVISARTMGVKFDLATGDAYLLNEGLIIAVDMAFQSLGGSNDVLTNSGTIVGDVALGAGDDQYRGQGGTISGTIALGAGNDYVILGGGRERLNGGDGTDTLDLRGTAGVRLALDGGFGGSGAAAGDTFAGFEIVQGSLRGIDVLRGDEAGNMLFGNGGRDQLSGMGGNDRLIGGAGRDALRGGLGDDVFVFTSLSERGDRILDFTNAPGNNDALELRASAFGGLPTGQLASVRFRFSTGNAAVDSDDRFILRKSDRTLWYDADGRGGQGPVLLADLPNKLLFTAQDIFLI